jgi:hypothetical protein
MGHPWPRDIASRSSTRPCCDPSWSTAWSRSGPAGSLNHPNLVAVYDFGPTTAALLITELLKGESPGSGPARASPRHGTGWGAQLAQGLAAAHARERPPRRSRTRSSPTGT